MKATLIENGTDIIITVVEDSLESILHRYGEKKDVLYEKIEKELKDIQ
jgi:hypothetical protein